MANLPAAGYIENNARTEGEIKAALADWRNVTEQNPGGIAQATLTIAAGLVTPTRFAHAIDTEGAAATDDLTNGTQTNLPDGSLWLIRSVASARVVVVKHSFGGAGQYILHDGADVTLRDPRQFLLFVRNGSNWEEVARSESLYFRPSTEDAGFVLLSAFNATGYLTRTRLHEHGQCRLTFVSATQIKLIPFDGAKLMVKATASGWQPRDIPSAGITAANTLVFVNGASGQNLAASTTYEVYIFLNGSTLTIDFRTPGHSTDATTGVEIKTGVDTRTLVGMVRTNASSQFVDSESQRFVVSYFNAQPKPLRKAMHSADITTASASLVELNGASSRAEFLLLGNQPGWVHCLGSAFSDTGGAHTYMVVRLDGAAPDLGSDFNSSTSLQAGPVISLLPIGIASAAEGYHYASPWGMTGGSGTSTFRGGATLDAITTLGIIYG